MSIRLLLSAVAGVLLFSVPCYGQIRLVTSSGDYFIDTSSNPPAVLPITQVVDVTGQDPAPGPSPPENLVELAEELAKQANDPSSAKLLGEVYGESSKQIREKNLTVDQGLQAIKLTSEVLLTSKGVKEQWQPFLDKMQKEIDKVRGSSPEKVATALEEIKKGLEQAAAQEAA